MPVVDSRMAPCTIRLAYVEVSRDPPAMYKHSCPANLTLSPRPKPATFFFAWFAFLIRCRGCRSPWMKRFSAPSPNDTTGGQAHSCKGSRRDSMSTLDIHYHLPLLFIFFHPVPGIVNAVTDITNLRILGVRDELRTA